MTKFLTAAFLSILCSSSLLHASANFDEYLNEAFADKKSYVMPQTSRVSEILENTLGTPYFEEKTKLSEKLGGQIRVKVGIIMAFQLACEDMRTYLVQGGRQQKMADMTVGMFAMRTQSFVEAILAESHLANDSKE